MRRTKKLYVIFIIAILLLSFIGCTSGVVEPDKTEMPKSSGSFPMEITDSYNRTLLIDSEPQRVISIAPNITETIFALNKGDKLVGRSEFCDFPEEALKIHSVGSIMDPSIEKIVELKPDLVIVSTHFSEEVIDKIEKAGIKVAAFYGNESFEGVYSTIESVGMVLNAKEESIRIVEEMESKVADVLNKVADRQSPTVYYVVSYGEMGDYTAGGNTFIGQMIEMAGGINVASDTIGWSYSLEKLVEKKPEILICSKYYDSKEGIKNSHGYKDLDAVKNERIYEIDNNLLDRQGIRLADGLVELAKIIHPEAF